MYKIYADNDLIYDSTLDDYVITKGEVTKEVNKSGSFVFTLLQSHPYYDRIEKLKTIIRVYKNNSLEFRGRIITEDLGFRNDKTFTCEGEMSFLLDSIQRPFTFSGTPAEFFTMLINNHNSQVEPVKRFTIGEITVTDPNDYIVRSNSKYDSTMENVNSRLLDPLGGYIEISQSEDNTPVISYLEDYKFLSRQTIEFGENLLDFVKTNAGDEIATVVIPLGAKLIDTDEDGNETESRLTIESVNDGLDYIEDADAIARYGRIVKVVEFDDVTLPENLIQKGRTALSQAINQNITIELSAVDLSLWDKSIDHFRLGDYIDVISKPHRLEDRLLLKKITEDLLKPANDTISLGYTYSTFADTAVTNQNRNDGLVTKIEEVESNIKGEIADATETLRSLIDQQPESILLQVSQTYATNESVTSSISTSLTQLTNSFNFEFETINKTIDDTGRQITEDMKKYIRFIDGKIYLGEVGNELELRIAKDRISFLSAGNEVAYFSNNKLYVKDGEYTTSLKIGSMAFVPRKNGNLSFKKIGG